MTPYKASYITAIAPSFDSDSVVAVFAIGKFAKGKSENIFFWRLPLCSFLAKILKENKIVMKSFFKICNSKSKLNCEFRLSLVVREAKF